MPWLDAPFFSRDVLSVARDLVGVELHWHGCSGLIVETEAYAVDNDPACHTASRPSARSFVQTMPPGTAYVYLNYGMYWLFNLLVKGGERDGLILVRALEPRLGKEQMLARRGCNLERDLCSGPGKLGRALGLLGSDHGALMVGSKRHRERGLFLPAKGGPVWEVAADVRVGISQAADFPWRFLAKGHPHVSVPFGKVKPLGNAQGATASKRRTAG